VDVHILFPEHEQGWCKCELVNGEDEGTNPARTDDVGRERALVFGDKYMYNTRLGEISISIVTYATELRLFLDRSDVSLIFL
jgi:hypothetical protein